MTFGCWVAETNPAWSAIYPIPARIDPTKVSELANQVGACSDLSLQVNTEGVSGVNKERVPSRAADTATYLLSAADLCLRGIIGPGRHIRARWQVRGSKVATIESHPTLAAMAAIRKADQLFASEGALRGTLMILSKGCMRLSESFERAANRVSRRRF